ncbi:DUF4865 family protein [Sphaerisporangium sp. NPDC088356]|uniref:DUF4865 family protein n=1 Tax=Sphaerisporangium sp. NPDC088356 TaxID=3154871 RepID=UPI003433562C
MQYEITLPADYDMAIIRHRVATKGTALDGFRGLGLKAYAIRQRGFGGSPVNQYVPSYLAPARRAARTVSAAVRRACRCARCRGGRRSRGSRTRCRDRWRAPAPAA